MDFKLFLKNSDLTSQDRKQRLMLIILAAAVLAAAAILYSGFWNSSTPSSPSAETPNTGLLMMEEKNAAPSDVIKKIDFDADFLKNPYLRNLKIYGDWPLQIDEKGRANPFLPY